MIAASDRISRAFNRSGATRAVVLDKSEAFDRVGHAGLLQEIQSYGISGHIFGHISSFLSNRQLWVVLGGKSSQEYPVNAGVPQGSIIERTLFLLYINDLSDDGWCYEVWSSIWSMANTRIDFWTWIWYIRNTVDWARKWLVEFSAGKN